MIAELYMIPECPMGRLAIMPRPRAGDWLDDEAASWRRQGLDVVVSLLEEGETVELGLEDEPAACERAGLRFINSPLRDRDVPKSETAITELTRLLTSELWAGRSIGIHCRIGVGRSALVAVCVLAVLGIPIEECWAAVERARGLSVPDTTEQRTWVSEWFKKACPEHPPSQ